MNATTTGPQVAAYVSAVREHLVDLSPEVVEELTGGLEADLTDALEGETTVYGAPSVRERFGDPGAYAEELRSAAGLPPRRTSGPSVAHLREGLGNVWELGRSTSAQLRAQPWWPAVSDFLVTLRPVWWVLRAWLVYRTVSFVFFPYMAWPRNFSGVVLLLAAVVGSVELGRRTASGALRGRWPTVVPVLNVIAVLLILPALAAFPSPRDDTTSYSESQPQPLPSDGIYNQGTGVHNVFPYDQNGTLLHDVRLLDENGRPIVPGDTDARWDAAGQAFNPVEAQLPDGSQAFSVFPLRERKEGFDGVEQPVKDAPPPVVALPPLVPAATPTDAPSASSSAAPSASASAGPSAPASVSPSAPAPAGPSPGVAVGQSPHPGVGVAPGSAVRVAVATR